MAPDDLAVAGELQGGIGGGGHRLGAGRDLGGHRRHGGGLQGAGFRAFRGAVRHEPEALDPANVFAFHMDGAIFLNSRHQFFLLGQALHQHTGTAVDKTLCQPLMQGIRQLVLYLSAHKIANRVALSASPGGWRRRSRSGHG